MSDRAAYATRIAVLHTEFGISHEYPAARGLELQLEAGELASIGPDNDARDCQLIRPAALAWKAMRAHAREYDIELIPLSGFRSVERQVEIVRGKLALGEPIEVILKTIAAPGYSEHHTGRAIDIGTTDDLPLEETFADTRAFSWLERHAGTFGFHMSFPRENRHGFIYEPWHWCWHAS